MSKLNELVIEMLHQKYLYSIKTLNSNGTEKKKYFFIQYGLSHPEYLKYCLDYIDIFDELESVFYSIKVKCFESIT